MRRHFQRLIAALVLLAAAGPRPAAGQVSLTILHTNDTHGHLLPFSYADAAVRGGELQGLTKYRDVGGIARRATLVTRIRRELDARKAASWLVDAGDYSDGSAFSIEYHGEADVAAMNAVGYDLGTIGNHELNGSLAQLRKLIAATASQLVSANVIDRSTGKPLVKPYVVRTVGPVRIGVFGLTTREAAGYQAVREGLEIADEVASAKATVAALSSQADIIILVSHAGADMDERIAARVPQIDVIVGGHSHSRLPSGAFVWQSEDLLVDDINGTVIVQAHQWGGELGRLDLLFTRDGGGLWHVDRYRARLLPVTADLPPDPAIAALVDRYWKPIAARYEEVIGRAAGDFRSRGGDAAEYNLVADAVREVCGGDFALENEGGVRAPLLQGPIRRYDLAAMDPFGNTVVLFTARGREIRQLLTRHAPAVSGIRYRLDSGKLTEVTIGGKRLEDEQVYTGVTNSYFAAVALKNVATRDTGRLRLDVLTEYIRRKGTVLPSYDGRKVVVRRKE
jgi:5'-nucleotidase / UDP-sugar diphosphatase